VLGRPLQPLHGGIVERADHLQPGAEPAVIQPSDEIVIAVLHRDRARFVNELGAILEAEHVNRLPPAVNVS